MMQMKDYKGVPQVTNDAIELQPASGTASNLQDVCLTIPSGTPNCPRGLEYLTSLDQLLIRQKVDKIEAFGGGEICNRYKITNSLGQNVYFAGEESSWWDRNLVGKSRAFEIRIIDNFQKEVIHLTRPNSCSMLFCFPSCLQKMEVSAPPGQPIGTIEQKVLSYTLFDIKNANDDIVMSVTVPGGFFHFRSDVEFIITSATGEVVGKIAKQWSGLAKEMFTDADNFNVTFPVELDVRMKALIISATFLIDMMFYES